MTTKEQEYKALAKIQKIIADLETDGERSYIGIALNGALELAESNIRDDFGDSAKYFIDGFYAEQKEKDAAVRKIAELEKALADQEEKYKAELNAMESKTLVYDDYKTYLELLQEKIHALTDEVSEAAEKIVELATQPDCKEFKSIVEYHRGAKAGLEKYKAMREWLCEKYGR